MKKFIFVLLIFNFSFSLFANEEKSLDQISESLKLEKKQVETIVDTMVRSGRISPDEGSRAKREIASVKEDDFEELKSETIRRLKSSNIANN